MNGGIEFKCPFCKFSVNTVDLKNTTGNRRTQAAAVMNEHATEFHFAFLRPVSGRSKSI